MKAKKKALGILCSLLFFACLLSACSMLTEENVKLRDLEMTVLGEERIPEELQKMIREKESEPFRFTYKDKEHLYICIGYGEKESGGYSVAVNELYLTDRAICVSTSLLGPEGKTEDRKTASCPYIVIRTEPLDKTVIFE